MTRIDIDRALPDVLIAGRVVGANEYGISGQRGRPAKVPVFHRIARRQFVGLDQ